ncbi:uncharacterized protein B0T15DRAFT_84515 [Chaetomium strumarium]|uniref:Uncharacterized protein n=1 Tax=Chaetomium strumarium TaxID=1170767 RepID=A0AAJ0GX40_9PEZI|nr:hypothetical protein B0T15DRAFT_84515 [Chaetomium strumarium]
MLPASSASSTPSATLKPSLSRTFINERYVSASAVPSQRVFLSSTHISSVVSPSWELVASSCRGRSSSTSIGISSTRIRCCSHEERPSLASSNASVSSWANGARVMTHLFPVSRRTGLQALSSSLARRGMKKWCSSSRSPSPRALRATLNVMCGSMASRLSMAGTKMGGGSSMPERASSSASESRGRAMYPAEASLRAAMTCRCDCGSTVT